MVTILINLPSKKIQQVISLDERRKSAAIIQKLSSKKVYKNAKKAAEKKSAMKQKVGLMSLGEKNLFQEAKQITQTLKEKTIKEQELLNESLVLNYNFVEVLKMSKLTEKVPSELWRFDTKSDCSLGGVGRISG